jgi:hypothetical protein
MPVRLLKIHTDLKFIRPHTKCGVLLMRFMIPIPKLHVISKTDAILFKVKQ